jgi:hypothetical protein
MAIAAIEDWPPLSTQPIGFQPDGTVVELHPPTLPDQLVTIAGAATEPPPPPMLTLDAGEPVTAGEVLPIGWNLFLDTETHTPLLFNSDGLSVVAPDDGENYPISVT